MKKKVIYINGRFLSQRLTGVQRVAYEIIISLDKLVRIKEIKIIAPKNTLEEQEEKLLNRTNKVKIIKKGVLKGVLWEQLELPLFIKRNIPLLNLGNISPLLAKNSYTYLHDVSYYRNPDFFSIFFRTWYKIIIPLTIFRSKKIFTNSNFSKNEIVNIYRNKKKLHVIYLGHNHVERVSDSYSINILEKYNLVKGNFILAVGSLAPNKNFTRLIQAVDKINNSDIKLVIIGAVNKSSFNKYDLKGGKFIWLNYLEDKELFALYQTTRFFIFPSIYEGFGLPPLEAAKLGCISAVSNTSALPEIYGDSVIYFNPLDVESISDTIVNLWEKEDKRFEYLDSLKVLFDKYDWEKSSQKIYDLIYT